MLLCKLLAIPGGVTALIGSGGKTTAMYILAAELKKRGTVICATSTRIFPPEHLPLYTGNNVDELVELLLEQGCVCVGAPVEKGKLGPSPISMDILASAADFVLVEADGSKGLPLKAHLSHEPVIPPEAKAVILMVGASGFGKPVCEAAHRPERFAELAGMGESDAVTPAAAAAVIRAERLGNKIFVNQAEDEDTLSLAGELAGLVEIPVFAGALREGVWQCLS